MPLTVLIRLQAGSASLSIAWRSLAASCSGGVGDDRQPLARRLDATQCARQGECQLRERELVVALEGHEQFGRLLDQPGRGLGLEDEQLGVPGRPVRGGSAGRRTPRAPRAR